MATPKKKPEERKKMGAPTKYTEQLADKICGAVSVTTDGLDKVCARYPEFPDPTTIYEWRIKYPYLSKKYEDAKRSQAELLANEIIQIADDSSRDVLIKQGKDGEEYEMQNTEFIARSRLRVDARKWVASKLLPKVYGDRTINESTVTIKYEDQLKNLDD